MARFHNGYDTCYEWDARIKDCPYTVRCRILDIRNVQLDDMLAWLDDRSRPGLYMMESNNLNRSLHDRTVTYVHFSDRDTAFEYKIAYG